MCQVLLCTCPAKLQGARNGAERSRRFQREHADDGPRFALAHSPLTLRRSVRAQDKVDTSRYVKLFADARDAASAIGEGVDGVVGLAGRARNVWNEPSFEAVSAFCEKASSTAGRCRARSRPRSKSPRSRGVWRGSSTSRACLRMCPRSRRGSPLRRRASRRQRGRSRSVGLSPASRSA